MGPDPSSTSSPSFSARDAGSVRTSPTTLLGNKHGAKSCATDPSVANRFTYPGTSFPVSALTNSSVNVLQFRFNKSYDGPVNFFRSALNFSSTSSLDEAISPNSIVSRNLAGGGALRGRMSNTPVTVASSWYPNAYSL